MKSKCGHCTSLHWSGTKLLHLGGPGRTRGSQREQPSGVVPGIFQQGTLCWHSAMPANREERRTLHPCSFHYSSIQILVSSIETILGENPAVTVFADFRISFFRRAPTATFHDSKHNIVHVHFDATRGWLLTSGTDKVIKVGARRLL